MAAQPLQQGGSRQPLAQQPGVSRADAEPGPATQLHFHDPVSVPLERSDLRQLHERRPVHAHQAMGLDPHFQVVHLQARQMGALLGVEQDIFALRLNPSDRPDRHEDRAPPSLHPEPFALEATLGGT